MKVILCVLLFCPASYSATLGSTKKLNTTQFKKQTHVIFEDNEVPQFVNTVVDGKSQLYLDSQSKSLQLEISK